MGELWKFVNFWKTHLNRCSMCQFWRPDLFTSFLSG